MKPLALLVGLALLALGLAGLIEPDLLVHVARRAVTTAGLWVVALVRIGIGVVLWMAARVARNPTALRVIAALFLVSGVITPFFGSDRARAMVDAVLLDGPVSPRVWSAVSAALGGFILYTLSDARRAVYRPASTSP